MDGHGELAVVAHAVAVAASDADVAVVVMKADPSSGERGEIIWLDSQGPYGR